MLLALAGKISLRTPTRTDAKEDTHTVRYKEHDNVETNGSDHKYHLCEVHMPHSSEDYAQIRQFRLLSHGVLLCPVETPFLPPTQVPARCAECRRRS